MKLVNGDMNNAGRSPSWGAWIEIITKRLHRRLRGRRSPSWGAWIEITLSVLNLYNILRRSPSWGAWIEIPK